MTPKKIAILRFSSIGDIVLISPVIRALYLAGGYSIHFVTKKAFGQVNIDNKYLTKQHLFDKDPREILLELKEEHFDFVVDLHKNIRSKRLLRSLGVKSTTFSKLNIKKWLLVHFKMDLLPDLHIVDRYLQAIETLDHQVDEDGLDMFIAQENHVNIAQHDLKVGEYTVFVLGAAHFTKRIPQSILEQLIQQTSGTIVLVGGPAEEAIGTQLAESSSAQVHNFCGATNLQQSASLIEQSKQVVTADTGMMHIAAAYHKKILVLWGNTVPQLGMYPYYGKRPHQATYFEVPDLSCRPCSKIGFDSCPKGHFDCMMKQDVQAIVTVLNQGYLY